ncbi:MAG: MFS transporter [bacterium]|nr:MFS transporter [bacterium]
MYKTLWGLGGGLMLPIIVLYFLARNFTLAEFMVLLSVLNLSVFVFEVPTGVVADKFSRKWSVCSGTFFMGVSVLIMLTTVNYPLLIVGFISWGLGESLVSGADSALLYDSLQAEGMAAAFQQSIGTAISLQLAATVSGTILCGIIVDRVGLRSPLSAGLGVILLAAIVTALFKEPPFLQADRKEMDKTFNAQVSSYITHLQASFRFIGQSRELMALIFINIVILRLAFLTERPFAQPYLASFGYNPGHISYLHTLFYGSSALFAKYSHKLTTRMGDNERNSLSLVGLLGIVFLAIMVNAWSSSVVVAAMAGIYLMKGVFDPLMQDSLNRRVASEKRASCLSIAKMGNNFLGMFLGPLFGYLSDAFSLKLSLFIFQWMFGLLLTVSIIWGWKVLGRISEPEPAIPDTD